MATITVHVFQSDNGMWTVKREGRKASVFTSKAEAIASARKLSNQQRVGQVVIHEPSGAMRITAKHGLPDIQPPPIKSRLGDKKIEQAVSRTLVERLMNAG